MKKYFTCHANLEVSKKSDASADDGRYIEGYVSTPDIDRTREIVDPSAFAETLKTFMMNPILFFNHNWDEGIGKIVEAEIRPKKGLWVRAQIAEGTELSEKVWTLIKQGVYNAFSFAFRISKSKDIEPDDKESLGGKLRRIILGLDLLEASVVTIPANARATFSMAKGMLYGSDLSEMPSPSEEITGAISELRKALISTMKEDREAFILKSGSATPDTEENDEETDEEAKEEQTQDEKADDTISNEEGDEDNKGAAPKRNQSLLGTDVKWDAGEAIKQLRKYASSDGSGELDKINYSKFAKGFLWFDDAAPKKVGSYKLPYCTVIDGKVYAVPRGIFAAAGVIRGARGGVNIPKADLTKVKATIEAWYKAMNRESPFAKRSLDLDWEEFKDLFTESSVDDPLVEDVNLLDLKTAIEAMQTQIEELLKRTVDEDGYPQIEKEENELTPEDSALLEKIFQAVSEIKGKVVVEEDNPSDNEEEENAE